MAGAIIIAGVSPTSSLQAQVTVRPVLQLGHDRPATLAAWLDDGHRLVTVGPRDLIVWEASRGQVLDRQSIPALPGGGQFTPISIRVDGGHVILQSKIHPLIDDNNTCSSVRLNTEAVFPSEFKIEDLIEEECVAVKDTRARNNGDSWLSGVEDITVFPGNRGGSPVRLINVPRLALTDAELTPDGKYVLQSQKITYGRETIIKIELRSVLSGAIRSTWTYPDTVSSFFPISDGKVILEPVPIKECRSARQFEEAFLLDIETGLKAGKIQIRPNMAPVGETGFLLGVLPEGCQGHQDFGGDQLAIGSFKTGEWKPLVLPKYEGRTVRPVSMTSDGKKAVVVIEGVDKDTNGTDVGDKEDAVYMIMEGDFLAGKPTLKPLPFKVGKIGESSDLSNIDRMKFSVDNKMLIAKGDNYLYVYDATTGTRVDRFVVELDESDEFYFIEGDSMGLIMGGRELTYMLIKNYNKDEPIRVPATAFISAGLLPNGLAWTVSDDGVVRYYDRRCGKRILTSFPLPNNGYFNLDFENRYDTNQGADSKLVRWQVSDRPLDSLPPQMFMRDRYEPDLLQRRLDCTAAGNCDKVFTPLPPVAAINRALPRVRVVSVDKGPTPDTVQVTVEAAQEQADDGRLSGLTEVRLLRDNRSIVTWTPQAPPSPDASVRKSFVVQVPSGRDVSFTAYAFNNEQRKGETSDPVRFTPAPFTRPRRAYVLTIGIDSYDIKGRNLSFAGADARALASKLRTIDGYEVRTLTLTSEGGQQPTDHARKTLLQAAFGLLSGQPGSWARQLKAAGIDTTGFGPATPDDIVIISWSGHGLVFGTPTGVGDGQRSSFALLPSDVRLKSDGATIDPASLVTADDLTEWLRPLDAGEVAFIIDACHSGASVAANGFKPGPMGDRTLGQLAFDKGIRILAATQADDVAAESSGRGLGLLTATLIDSGLGGQAPGTEDGWVRLDAVLRHAAATLPERLAAEQTRRTKEELPPMLVPDTPLPPPRVQVPAVFDFTGQASPAWLKAVQP